jgi:hypothetical protein
LGIAHTPGFVRIAPTIYELHRSTYRNVEQAAQTGKDRDLACIYTAYQRFCWSTI